MHHLKYPTSVSIGNAYRVKKIVLVMLMYGSLMKVVAEFFVIAITSNHGNLAETVVTMVNVCKRCSDPPWMVKLKLQWKYVEVAVAAVFLLFCLVCE